MINAVIYEDKSGALTGFDIHNHGDPIVCAAVSILSQNTVNAVEALTDADFECDVEDEEYLSFRLTDITNKDAQLLLKSLKLGLSGIAQSYPKSLQLKQDYSE